MDFQSTSIELTPELTQMISAELARNFGVIPLDYQDNNLLLGCDDSIDQQEVSDELEMILGYEISFKLIDSVSLNRLVEKHYRLGEDSQNNKSSLFTINSGYNEDFIVKIINEAKSLGSSDLHFEIYEKTARIRIRIDGVLIERYQIDIKDYPEIVNKIKIRSKLNITEKRLPQDGRIQLQGFDIRVSILPTLHGEKIVLRILGHDASNINLEKLGFSQFELEAYSESIKKTNGIVLVSGPTGSGKTTTLYATLKILNEEKRNIVTVEDPIEYTLKGINQVQLKEDIGLTFSSALKSFLRQDPDVIMLGEIRDAETAKMAIRAALTGHLVLSTIHTNSAWGTISRLLDMGVPSFLLANTLNVSVAQRLIRKLCTCKIEEKIEAHDLPVGFEKEESFISYKASGCTKCHFTGYKGRQALYEVIPIDKTMALAVKEEKFNVDELLTDRNIKSLSSLAFNCLKTGVTSLEEIYPILSE